MTLNSIKRKKEINFKQNRQVDEYAIRHCNECRTRWVRGMKSWTFGYWNNSEVKKSKFVIKKKKFLDKSPRIRDFFVKNAPWHLFSQYRRKYESKYISRVIDKRLTSFYSSSPFSSSSSSSSSSSPTILSSPQSTSSSSPSSSPSLSPFYPLLSSTSSSYPS